MLIVFDLDDTLVETTRCLTRFYLKKALKEMVRAGFWIQDFESAYQNLLSLNQKKLFSKEALTEFCAHQSQFLSVGLQAMKSLIPDEIELEAVEGALLLLEELQSICPIALVTRGEPQLQMQKMKKAGLPKEQFSKVVVSKVSGKKEAYVQVFSELCVDPQDVWVCGDRVPLDLSPAKELGCKTIHFRNGRGKYHHEPKADVDFSIQYLKNLRDVL